MSKQMIIIELSYSYLKAMFDTIKFVQKTTIKKPQQNY